MSGIKKHGKTVPWKRTDQVETLVLQQVLKDFAVVAKKKKKFPKTRQTSSFQCTAKPDAEILHEIKLYIHSLHE